MDEKLIKFLGVLKTANWRQNIPKVWNEQLRQALSDDLISIGFGGVLELSNSGHALLAKHRSDRATVGGEK